MKPIAIFPTHRRTLRCTAALALLVCAAGASAQVTDTKIPLNFNAHLMVHAGEQVAVDTAANADAILYRSIADRGLMWDPTNANTFGGSPIVGGTGITYSLFDSVGYTNSTAAGAAANAFDGIFLGSRVWDRGLEFAVNSITSTGAFTAWTPVVDIISLSGDGVTATATTSGAHGLAIGQRVAIVGASDGNFDGEVVVTGTPTGSSFTYASSGSGSPTGSIFTNSTKTAQALYVTSDGGATMAVKTITAHTFGVGGGNNITISGSSVAAYNVQGLVTATNAPTALSGTGSGTVSATTTVNHGFATGDSVTIAGATGGSGTWNGTFTVTVTGDTTFTYPASGNGTPTGTITATNTRVFYMANTGGGSGVATGTRIVAATDIHDTAPEVTTLASPVTVDATTEIGVLYMVSDSGGPFNCILTFNNGSVDTNVFTKLAAADWFGNTAEVGTYSPFVSLHKRVIHTTSGTTYTTFQGCSNNDAATLQTFLTTNGGPNLQVTEGIISIPNMIAAGVNVAGQQLTKITFQNQLTNQYANVTAITSDGTTATATVASVTDYIVGEPIEITGIAQAATTTATGLNGDGITTTATTAAPHGLITGQTVVVTGATPSSFNTATTGAVITVTGTNTFTYANATLGTSTVAGTATVVAGAMPLNGMTKILSVDAIANKFTYASSAVANGSAAILLLNNNLKITAASLSSGVLTVTTLLPHGLNSAGGDLVTLSGFTTGNLNGQFRTIDAPTTTTFRIRNPTAASTSAQRSVNRFGRGRGYSIYGATVRTGTPTNSTCAAAQPIGPAGPAGVSVTGTNAHLTAEASPPTHTCTTTGENGVYYTYTAVGNNPIQISTCSFFLTNLSVYTGSCGSLTQVTGACNAGTGTGCNGSSTSSNVAFTGAMGTTYYIRVAGQANATGTFNLTVKEFTNTSCAGSVAIPAGDTNGTTILNAGGGTTPCGGGSDTNAVWYQYTASGSGSHLVEARTCLDLPGVGNSSGSPTALPLDTTLAVYSDCSGGAPIVCNDDGCSVTSRVQWTATPGTTYFLRVATKSATVGNFTLHIDDPIHTDIQMPIQFNWNGICHGTYTDPMTSVVTSEQTVPTSGSIGATNENRFNQNGYRSIADRSLLFDPNNTVKDALNYGGTLGYQGIQYQLYTTPLQSDMIHLGNRTLAGGGRPWALAGTTWPAEGGTSTNLNGLRPLWLNNDDQTPDQVSSMSGLSAEFGPNTKIGILYQASNVQTVAPFARFDVTLGFTDSTSTVVTLNATDWFYNNTGVLPDSPSSNGAGLEKQRVLGIYHGTQNTDQGQDAASPNGIGPLKVDEAVISTASLIAHGFDPTGKTLASMTFGNVRSGNAAGDNFSSAIGIFTATIRDPASFNLNFPPSGTGTVTPNQLNAGGTGKMTVSVSRGSGSNNQITSVIVDASSIGLSSTLALNDSGTGGDAHANDNIWSSNVSFPINSPPNSYVLPFTVTDGQGRTAMGNIIFSVVPPTGTLTPSTGVVAGVTSVHASFVFGTAGGISSVVLDASQLGLSPTLALNDSGTGGDTAANDGTWGINFIPSSTVVAGTYMIPYTITDTASNMASGNLSITIIPPPPANDDCSAAIALSSGGTYNGDNSQATSNDGAASTCQASVSKAVWFSFSPPTTGAWLVSTCGTTQDTVVSIFNADIDCTGISSASNILACNDDGGVACAGLQASVQATLNSGSTYLIRMSSFGAAAAGGAYSISVTPYVTGACCNNSSGACTQTASTGCSATTSTYQGDNVACPTTCAVIAVCCNNSSGACTSIYGGSCPSGTTGAPGGGTTCGANTCPASGSCCENASGACTPTCTFSCASSTATFNSSLTCSPTPCAVAGSCCNNNTGACTFIYGGSCAANATAGVNLACDSSTCPPVGTCCDNVTGACSVLYGGIGCTGNATFTAATVCGPTVCPQFTWACCFSDGSCLALYQFDCNGHSGAVWEPGQTCGVFTCPSCTNLLSNPGGETGDMSGWILDANGGGDPTCACGDVTGWKAGTDQVNSGTYAFATSYVLDQRHQLIDLTQFFTPAQLDAAPTFAAGEWVHSRGDQGAQYYILIQLLAADQTTVIATFNDGTSTALHQLTAGTPYFLVSTTFSGYGTGARYLRFEDGGRDIAGWSGHYGVHFDDAFAGPTGVSSACCSTSGCSVITNADCITAGGSPQGCGTSCSPSPCPGVCCRGATCNTAIAQNACSTGGALAGAIYATSSSTCNGLSTTSPCCYPDYDKLNGIQVADIFAFLNDWFAGQKYTIVGGDGAHGTLAVQNIFDFLNAWFAGGC